MCVFRLILRKKVFETMEEDDIGQINWNHLNVTVKKVSVFILRE